MMCAHFSSFQRAVDVMPMKKNRTICRRCARAARRSPSLSLGGGTCEILQLLGINAFTYALGALALFFLGMNLLLGPGWLGQSLGWEDVGTFTRVSESLPLSVDVSGPDYLLQ